MNAIFLFIVSCDCIISCFACRLLALIPGGREGDLAGLNLFTTAVLAWLPPLIITAFNEINMLKTGLLILPVFFFLGAAIIYSIDMEQGRKDILPSLKNRQRFRGDEDEKPASEEVETGHSSV